MKSILWASLRRLVRESRTLLLLTVAGTGLGVGSVVAIQSLNQGALQAFAGSVQAVSGQADLTILGTVPTVPADVLPRVLADPQVQDAWPLVRVDGALEDGSILQVVGFDVFAPVRYPLQQAPVETGGEAAGDLVAAALRTPGWVAVTPSIVKWHGCRNAWLHGESTSTTPSTSMVPLSLRASW